MTGCPMGHVPVKTTFYPKTGMCRAPFAREYCEKYPHWEECKVREQRKNYAVHVSAKMAERTRLSTDEYKKLTRKRNAIKGIPSVLRRRYHADDIPVLVYLRSRQFFLFKIGAYNFNKLLKHNRKARGKQPPALTQNTHIFFHIK